MNKNCNNLRYTYKKKYFVEIYADFAKEEKKIANLFKNWFQNAIMQREEPKMSGFI